MGGCGGDGEFSRLGGGFLLLWHYGLGWLQGSGAGRGDGCGGALDGSEF